MGVAGVCGAGAVVSGAVCRVGEDGVGFRDAHEAVGGGGVGGVVVGVVEFGEVEVASEGYR